MTTIAPGPTVKPWNVSQVSRAQPLDDDPTVYPESEVMSRDPTESDIAEAFEPVVRRHLAGRVIDCYVGSDNFIYWVKGNNKACVSPDVYVLPGIPPTARPKHFPGSKESCWKTWVHRSVPTFALEVKAWENPRKDELQSPERHDALGTKELVVFDPFAHERRRKRKRFVVYRRDDAGKLRIVIETNDRRIYSEQLEAFIVVDGDDENCLLRLGLGDNGEKLLPFEWELVEQQTRRADDEARRADDEARRADEAMRLAQETARQMAELQAELAKLRAGTGTSDPR